MKESDTYQEILEEGIEKGIGEGREQEVRSLIIRSGSRKLGPPSESIRSQLEAMHSVSALEAIIDRLMDGGASTWAELLPPFA